LERAGIAGQATNQSSWNLPLHYGFFRGALEPCERPEKGGRRVRQRTHRSRPKLPKAISRVERDRVERSSLCPSCSPSGPLLDLPCRRPGATIFNASLGNGRCSAFASSHGAPSRTRKTVEEIKDQHVGFFRIGPPRFVPGGPGSGLVFNVGYCGSHSSRTPAFSGCAFLPDGRAERHSAVQRIPRSHSSASLRSRSALALSCAARASLRYRIARALLMASQIPTQQNEDSSTEKKIWFGAVRWRAVR